jgi:hypothetical protein
MGIEGRNIRRLVVHPLDRLTLYAQSRLEGMFISTDGGDHWTPFNAELPDLFMAAIALSPKDPSAVYVGTGSGAFRSDVIPIARGHNKHNEDGYLPGDGDPRNTIWHELHPNYSVMWEITDWIDDGDGFLGFSDTLDVTNTATEESVWESVRRVTATVTMTAASGPPDSLLYFDMIGENSMAEPIADPVGTFWYQVHPAYPPRYEVVTWDDNGNGYLDAGDYVELHALSGNDSCTTASYLVEDVATDMVTSCCGIFTGGYTGNCDCDHQGKRNLTDITRLIEYIYVTHIPLCCRENGNTTGDEPGKLNLGDITRLIDNIYISLRETALCGDMFHVVPQ